MKFLLSLALAASALLATTSTHAHTEPAHCKLELATLTVPATVKVAALASPTTGPTAHVSTSHPSFGGFHSTPSYHSFSATPSRSFTVRASSPSISTRPAITSAPSTYTYRVSGVPRTATYTPPASSSPPAEVHHYHSSGGGGGLSATDVILLNSALNSGHQSGATAASTTRYVSDTSDNSTEFAPEANDGLSGWQVFGLILLVCGLAIGFAVLLTRLGREE